jgi:hypothetical protein
MTSRRPSSSYLLTVIDAFDRCVAPEHHTRILGDALREAGLLDIPTDTAEFREFVSGPLTTVAHKVVGEAVATELSWTLMRQTSVRAPSSKAPGSGPPAARLGRTPLPTAEYTEDLFLRRADVLVVDPGSELIDELKIHLEAREYRVAHDKKAGELSRDAPPRLVLTNIEPSQAVSWGASALQGLGDKAPHLVVLANDGALAESPPHITRVLPREPLGPVVSAIAELLGDPLGDPS